MKNSSKNNLSGKNNKQYKKHHDSKFFSKKSDASKKNNNFLRNSEKYKGIKNLNESDKNKKNFSPLKAKNPLNKSNLNFSDKSKDNFQQIANTRNFDDWIWGKHSVYETLISERAVNRVWCTSEIFSSEKFYILLKELKLKGVLIEEVSWNRISQLTFGASHQGVALQLACSKTISLKQLIDFSKHNCLNSELWL